MHQPNRLDRASPPKKSGSVERALGRPSAASCLLLIRALAVEMPENCLEAHRSLRPHKKVALRPTARFAGNIAASSRATQSSRTTTSSKKSSWRPFAAQILGFVGPSLAPFIGSPGSLAGKIRRPRRPIAIFL